MRFEVERKFLVSHDGWRARAARHRCLRDGLVGQFPTGKVRVRLDETQAWLTVKGPRIGIGREEYEYEIPRADAEAMMRGLCQGDIIQKTRYDVPHAGLTWEVDVYEGALAGIVLAEIELDHADQPFVTPDWTGHEVTGDPRFSQATLLRLGAEAGLAAMEEILERHPTPSQPPSPVLSGSPSRV